MFVRGRTWHDSQVLEELPQGRLRLTLRVTHDWALRSWVLGFGAAARVTAPPELARSLADECDRMRQRYAHGSGDDDS
jgi:predicted DNA-binding transcriptional regulator YafY